MKVYIENKNNILNEILPRVKEVTNLLEADVLITWNSVLPQQTRNIELARLHGIPSVVMSHGHNSENDHNPEIIDNCTNHGFKPMLADKYLCYGQQGKDILLRSGVPEDKIAIVGCPICWDTKYLYISEKSKKGVVLGGYGGEKITDPKTGEEWHLKEQKIAPIKHEGGRRVAFFPNHSGHLKARTKEVYEAIKDVPNLCICASTNWLTLKEDNPFEELIADKSPARLGKIVFPNIQHPTNIQIVNDLISRSAVVVSVVPATASLVAYTCGVPVVMPDYDWLIRNPKDERVDLWTPADTIVPVEKLKETVENILNTGITPSYAEKIKHEAEYSAGASLGNPTENIFKELEKMVKSKHE